MPEGSHGLAERRHPISDGRPPLPVALARFDDSSRGRRGAKPSPMGGASRPAGRHRRRPGRAPRRERRGPDPSRAAARRCRCGRGGGRRGAVSRGRPRGDGPRHLDRGGERSGRNDRGAGHQATESCSREHGERPVLRARRGPRRRRGSGRPTGARTNALPRRSGRCRNSGRGRVLAPRPRPARGDSHGARERRCLRRPRSHVDRASRSCTSVGLRHAGRAGGDAAVRPHRGLLVAFDRRGGRRIATGRRVSPRNVVTGPLTRRVDRPGAPLASVVSRGHPRAARRRRAHRATGSRSSRRRPIWRKRTRRARS